MFSRDDFYCSVIPHGAPPIKAKLWLEESPWREHLPENGSWIPGLNPNWLTAGKECGSILSSRSWGGALRDNSKKGCVADSAAGSHGEISWMTFYKFQSRIDSFKWRWFYCERFVKLYFQLNSNKNNNIASVVAWYFCGALGVRNFPHIYYRIYAPCKDI